MPLTVSRHRNEAVKIMTSDGEIEVKVVEFRGKRVKISIDAPNEVKILRQELISVGSGKPAA